MPTFSRLFGRRHTPESVGLELLKGIEDGTVTVDPPAAPLEDAVVRGRRFHVVRLTSIPEDARESVVRAINELVKAAENRPTDEGPAAHPRPARVPVP